MPTRDDAPLGAPCWIDLFTSDPDRSRAFYGDLFGWTSVDAGEEFGHYVNFSLGDAKIAGAMRNDGSSGMGDVWSVYLAVADAEATVAATGPAGGLVHFGPDRVADLGVMALLGDASGAAVGIWQPDAHRGFGVIAEPGAPAWFELHTRDYAAAGPFYAEVFGWDVHVMSDTPEFRYSTFGEGDGALAGIMDASGMLPDGIPGHWAVYFATADTDASVARAVELGATVVQAAEDTPYGRLAVLTDPTGAAFRLIQPPAA